MNGFLSFILVAKDGISIENVKKCENTHYV